MECTIKDAGRRAVFAGNLTELAVLMPLLPQLAAGEVTFDLAGITRINSIGVRTWVDFIRAATAHHIVRLERCSVPFVLQMNMVGGFLGTAQVVSYYVPYVCDACGAMADELVLADDPRPDPQRSRPCADCGGNVEADYLPSEYFVFLERPG